MIARLNVNIKEGCTSFRFSDIKQEANYYRGAGKITLNTQSPHLTVVSHSVPEYNIYNPEVIYIFGTKKTRDEIRFKVGTELDDFQLIKLYNSMRCLGIELYVNRKPFSVGFI